MLFGQAKIVWSENNVKGWAIGYACAKRELYMGNLPMFSGKYGIKEVKGKFLSGVELSNINFMTVIGEFKTLPEAKESCIVHFNHRVKKRNFALVPV